MDPLTAGIITGGVAGIGNIAGTLLQNQQSQQNIASQEQFQTQMSDTAHQREVADLRAAGLNPILSASGSGASTPMGGAAPVQNVANGLGSAVSSGVSTALGIRQQQNQNDLTQAQVANTRNSTVHIGQQADLAAAQTAVANQDFVGKNLANDLAKQILPSMVKKAKAEGDWSQINQLMGVIHSGASSAGQLLNPFKNLIPGN